jgi:SAM-dependent methyltransferase
MVGGSRPPTGNATQADAKLTAPAFTRNGDDICRVLQGYAPNSGVALEIASGTGQHIVKFAAAMPHLTWHPTDIDPTRRASIDAYAQDARLRNLMAAADLNATRPGWAASYPDMSLIVLVNLLHLISEADAITLIEQASRALTKGGIFFIYGPFLRGGELTSAGDIAFDAALKAQDPNIGYKDVFDVLDTALAHGLEVRDTIEMPANNMALVFSRPN